jgi:hypothetical protein
MFERRWIRWLATFLVWTDLALFFASQTYLLYEYSGGQAHWRLVLKMNSIDWYVSG